MAFDCLQVTNGSAFLLLSLAVLEFCNKTGLKYSQNCSFTTSNALFDSN